MSSNFFLALCHGIYFSNNVADILINVFASQNSIMNGHNSA